VEASWILPATAATAALVIGILLVAQDRRAANVTFALFCTSASVWLGSYAMAYTRPDYEHARFWTTNAYVGITMLGPTIFHFVVGFLGRRDLRRWVWLAYGLGVVFMALSRTSLMLDGMHTYSWGFYPRAGVMYGPFLVLFFASYLAGLYLLWGARGRERDPRRRLQINYLLASTAVACVGSIDYVPKYGIDVYPFGSVFVLGMTCIVAFAIARHQLLGIELIIRRTLVFATLVSMGVGLVAVISALGNEVLGASLELPRWLTAVVTGAVVTLSYEPIRGGLERVTDRFLFQRSYDERVLLREFTDEAVTELDLERLVQRTTERLDMMLRPQGVVVLLRERDGAEFRALGGTDVTVPCALLDDEVVEPRVAIEGDGLFEALAPAMAPEAPELVLPLRLREELIGVLVLGPKKSHREYSTSEVELLAAMTKTLAIAVTNARQTTELALALDQATEAARAKSEFLAGVSHELRTPLNSIINLPEALLDDFVTTQQYACSACGDRFASEPGDEITADTPCPSCGAAALGLEGEVLDYCGAPEDTVRYLKSTGRAGRHLLGVVEDILNFSKVESGRLELVVGDVAFGELFEDVRDAVRGAAAKHNVRVDFEGADTPAIRADRLRLAQILVNLVGNAVKFSDENGIVTVTALASGDSVALEVRDRGIGIPADALDRIFESFRQVEGGHTRKYGGTGLGLAITKKLVELHEGTIEVESEVGVGSVFRVRLPRVAPPAKTDERAAEPVGAKETPVATVRDAGLYATRPETPNGRARQRAGRSRPVTGPVGAVT